MPRRLPGPRVHGQAWHVIGYRHHFRWMRTFIVGDWALGNPALAISCGSCGTPPWTPPDGHRVPDMLWSPSGFRLWVSQVIQEPPSEFIPAAPGIQRSASRRTPGVPAFQAPGSPAIYAACATGFAWIQSWHGAQTMSVLRRFFAMRAAHAGLLPRSRRTLSTTSVVCITHPSWSSIVHRLCPFTLWSGFPGLQIGRTLPRRLLRALRRHRTRVP